MSKSYQDKVIVRYSLCLLYVLRLYVIVSCMSSMYSYCCLSPYVSRLFVIVFCMCLFYLCLWVLRYPDRTQGGNPQNYIFSPTIIKVNQFQIISFTRATISKVIITMLVKFTKVYYLQSNNIYSNNNHISKRNQVDPKLKYIISKETK